MIPKCCSLYSIMRHWYSVMSFVVYYFKGSRTLPSSFSLIHSGGDSNGSDVASRTFRVYSLSGRNRFQKLLWARRPAVLWKGLPQPLLSTLLLLQWTHSGRKEDCASYHHRRGFHRPVCVSCVTTQSCGAYYSCSRFTFGFRFPVNINSHLNTV